MASDGNSVEALNTILNGSSGSVILSSTAEVAVSVCNAKTLPTLLTFAS
jgi:hypothetical protein